MKIKKYIPIGIGALGLTGLIQEVSANTDKHVSKDETEGRLDPDYKIEYDVKDEAITSPNGGKVIKVESKEKAELPPAVGELSVKDSRASDLSVKDAREGFLGAEPKYIVNGGNDIVKASYTGKDTAVTKVYYVLPSGQGIPATGTFISPNIVLSVGHMYLPTSKDDGEINKIVDATFHYNMGTTAPLERDWIPRDGVNVKLGDRNEMKKRMYFIDQNKYSSESGDKYSIDFQYDIALMKVDTPMQFTSPSDDAEPLSVVKTVGDQKAGDKIKYTGYGISFDETKNGAGKVTNPNIERGNLLSVTTNIQTLEGPGANGNFMKWQATTVGGFSGSSVRDSKDEIFGLLQYSMHVKEPNGYGGGLKFNQKTLDWIHKVINDNKVVGWREYNGGRYYFQDNGHLYRNTTKVIDGERWEFNKKGIATSLGKMEYGGVTIEYVDTEGKPLLNGKVLVEQAEVGVNYNYDALKDPYTSSLNSDWELKSVQQNGKDLGKNPSISGKVVAGKTVYKFVYSKKNANIKVKYIGTGQEETLDNGGKGYSIGSKVKVKPKAIPGYYTNDTEKEITIGENNVVEFKYTKRVNVLVKYIGTGQEETLDNNGQGYVIGEKIKIKPKQISGYYTNDTEKEITIGENNVVEFKYTKDTDVTRLKQLILEGNNTPKDMIESKYSSSNDKVVAEKLVKDIGTANEIVKSPNDHTQEKVNDLVKNLEKDIVDMVDLRKKQQKLKDVEVLDNEGSELMKKVRLKNRTEDSLRKYEEAKAGFIHSINSSVRSIKSGKLEETVTPSLANLKKAISDLKYKPIDKKEFERVRTELNTELGEKLELEYLNDVYRNEYKNLTDDVNRLIAHVGRQLPEDLLQEEFDVEVDKLKVRVPEVRELKAKLKIVIEEEKVRRMIAEYVKLSEEIRIFKLKVGSENKELLGNLAELVGKLDAGNRVLKDKSGVVELRKVIDDVRSGFDKVKESDKKTAETDLFNLTYDIRGGVNVTFTNSAPIGSVSSAGTVKDGSASRVVNSRLGAVVDTRDIVTTKPEDKQIIVGTKNERRFVRCETKPYNVVGKGQVLVAGATGLVEVWNINGEEVRFEVREVTDEVRG